MKFVARFATTFPNGSIGWAPGGPFDCLGPYAKVQNCPIETFDREPLGRLTCYATGYADTWFSVPAFTRKRGAYVSGYFTRREDATGCEGIVFVVHEAHVDKF